MYFFFFVFSIFLFSNDNHPYTLEIFNVRQDNTLVINTFGIPEYQRKYIEKIIQTHKANHSPYTVRLTQGSSHIENVLYKETLPLHGVHEFAQIIPGIMARY
jgi:hypothetical protein